MKVKDLLIDESKWTKYSRARGPQNNPVLLNSQSAVSFCLVGAIEKCHPRPDEFDAVIHRVIAEIHQDSVVDWNDDPATRFADVRNLVEKLDI